MTAGMEFGRPNTAFVETPRGYIGYQVFGEGDRDILFTTGALKNIDAFWDEPSAVRFFDRLTTMGRVIVFDMPGSGISDPVRDRSIWGTSDQHGEDIRAVLDAAGSEQAVVYGDTEGSFGAITFAATHPERVSALVLVNGIAKLDREDDYPIGMPDHVRELLSELYVQQHGASGDSLDLMAPSVAGDARFRNWWTRYQRLAIPMGSVRETFEWFHTIDVRHHLPSIQARTRVISRRDGRYHRLAYSEFLAANIPDAELIVVEGADTLPFHAGDFGSILDHVEDFVTDEVSELPSQRVLKTVLFTDIVGSTSKATDIGDEQWLDLLAEHDRILRLEIARYGGEEVKMTGDGCVAVFDRPVGAIRCAATVTRMLDAIGLPIRAGIHTGEIELRDGEIRGLGLHVAARVMDTAESGGVVVSRTVRDLVIGSNISFRANGEYDLKGVEGSWDLYCVIDQ